MRRFAGITQPLEDPALAQLSWVKINGSGTPATVLDSENVSSFTDNAGGDYTVTWVVPFATASSYAALLCASGQTGATTRHFRTFQSVTAQSVRTSLLDFNAASATDADKVYIAAIGEF